MQYIFPFPFIKSFKSEPTLIILNEERTITVSKETEGIWIQPLIGEGKVIEFIITSNDNYYKVQCKINLPSSQENKR